MNKHQFLATIILSFAVLFTACKKEGVYNPKEKISKIYNQFSNDSVTGDIGLIEKWTWDGNKLSRIDYLDEGCYETFEYKGSQIIGVSGNNKGSFYYIAFIYGDKSLLQKIDYYVGGELGSTVDITYNNDKISQMKIKVGENLYYSSKSMDQINGLSHIIRFIVSEQLAERMQQQIQKAESSYTIISFEYEGNNIKTETWTNSESADSKTVYTYVYDTKKNPFYHALSYNFGSFMCLSENNITGITKTMIYATFSTIEKTEYNYTYEGDFPSQRDYKHFVKTEVFNPETSEYETKNDYIFTESLHYEYK